MLRAMRNDFKKYSWTLWAVIIAFIGGFVVTDAFRGENRAEMGLIFINDEPIIRAEEFSQELMRRLQNYKMQFKDSFNKSMITNWRIPEQVLQEIISTNIKMIEADKLNISVTKNELQDEIVNLPVFQKDGKFIGVQRYKQILNMQRINIKEFEKKMREQVIGEKLQELVTGPLVLTSTTLLEKYKKEKDKVELDYYLLKPERIKEEIKIEDNEIADYYEKNKEDFKSKEKRSGIYYALKYEDYNEEVSVNPKSIYEYFKNNKSEFRLPGKTKVSRIFIKYGEKDRDQIFKETEKLQKELNKDNFAEKAKAHSQDNKASQGGDYGYTDWKNFTKQELTIIDSLQQDQISTPIDTQNGFSLLYIPEKIAERQQTFNEVKDKIKETIHREKVKEFVDNKVAKTYTKLKNSTNMKEKAKELGITVTETQLLTNGQTIKGIDDLGYISRKLFSLKENEIAPSVQLFQGMAIVQLTNIAKPTVEPLENVKDKVKTKLILIKKMELLEKESVKIVEKIMKMKDEKKIEEFLKEQNLNSTSHTYKRGNKLAQFPSKKDLDAQVFSMEENQFSQPLVFDDQIVFYKVKSKNITDTTQFENERDNFYKQQITSLKNNYFDSYINEKTTQYRVAQNTELFDQIKTEILNKF